MKCASCGADLPGEETCDERFQRLLTRDFSREGEAPSVHDLTVTTFLIQHPDSKFAGPSWMHRARLAGLREWARTGEPVAAIARRSLPHADRGPSVVVAGPVAGELTIADIDPTAPPGHADRVRAWARAVARRAG